MDFIISLLSDFLIPVMMLIFGGIMKNDAPDMNYMFGYRTKRSMLSRNTWEFAHKLCGTIWLATGGVMLALTIIVLIIMLSSGVIFTGSVVLIFIQISVMLLSIIPVETALKNTFDDEGNRK